MFQEPEFSVTRQHEEFIWLHDRFNENEEYAGLIVSFNIFFEYFFN
jgi:sorting nexin-5/6/32